VDHTPSPKTWGVPLRGSDSSVQYFKTGKFLKKKKKKKNLTGGEGRKGEKSSFKYLKTEKF